MIPPKYAWTMLCLALNFIARGQQQTDRSADTSILSTSTVRIRDKSYTGIQKTDTFYLRDDKGHLLLKQPGDYFWFEFKDFNKDGYKDIVLTHSSNIPEVLDLFVYIPSAQKFRKIRHFERFPAPERIKGTHYFYSYHKSGCADMIGTAICSIFTIIRQ